MNWESFDLVDHLYKSKIAVGLIQTFELTDIL